MNIEHKKKKIHRASGQIWPGTAQLRWITRGSGIRTPRAKSSGSPWHSMHAPAHTRAWTHTGRGSRDERPQFIVFARLQGSSEDERAHLGGQFWSGLGSLNAAGRDLQNGTLLDLFGDEEKSETSTATFTVDHRGVVYGLLRAKAREGRESEDDFEPAR